MSVNVKLAAVALWFLLPFGIQAATPETPPAESPDANQKPTVQEKAKTGGPADNDDEDCDDPDHFGTETKVTPPSST